MRREPKVLESHIKEQVKDYLAFKGIFNFPITQGLGSYRGAPDRVLHLNGRVVYLEIKTPTGKLSEYQERFEDQCYDDGISYWLIRSIEDLERLMEASC